MNRMDDLISRQDAIEAIASRDETNGTVKVFTGRQVNEILASLPSAERKRGEWIIRDNPGTGWYRVTCSECGEDFTSVIQVIGFFPNAKVIWDYCPNCGADMRGKQDDSF